MSNSKRLNGSLARPQPLEPPIRWGLISTVRVDPISRLPSLAPGCSCESPPRPAQRSRQSTPRPETLPHKIPLSFRVHPGQVNRTFPLDVPHHVRNRMFRRYRNHHVHVVGHQMALFNPALLVLHQPSKHLAQVPPQLPVQHLLRPFGMNTTWYLLSHFVWFRLSSSFLLSFAWRLTIASFCDGHPYLRIRQTATVSPA